MVQRKHIRFTLIVLMSLVISLPLWASAEEVGNFTEVFQRVDYQKGETSPPVPAKVQAPVEVKDTVNTYDISRAQIQFRDKTIISIAPKSKVTIEDYMFDPSKFERSATVDLITGVMKVVTSLEAKGTFKIKTATAIMGVRGTEFIAVSGSNFTVVYALDNVVCIKTVDLKTGKYIVRPGAPGAPEEPEEVCLPPGTMSVILPNQMPSTPQPVSAAIMAQAQGLVSTGITQIPGVCVLGSLPGVDLVSVADDLMSRGANLATVKASLTDVCYDATTYSYSAPGPPISPAYGSTNLPQGGGTASP